MVRYPPAKEGDRRDMGSIPGLGRTPGRGNGNSLQYSCLKIPWMEESDGLQSMGLQRVGHECNTLACMHVHTLIYIKSPLFIHLCMEI